MGFERKDKPEHGDGRSNLRLALILVLVALAFYASAYLMAPR